MPALNAGGARIEIQAVAGLVELDFKYMRMAAYENIWMISVEELSGIGIIVPRRASDVSHKHFHSFTFPEAEKRTMVQKTAVVAVADYALKRLAPEIP